MDEGGANGLNSGTGRCCEGERGGAHEARGDGARLLQMVEGTHPGASGMTWHEAEQRRATEGDEREAARLVQVCLKFNLNSKSDLTFIWSKS
jgi:hypothetical protein